MRHRNWVLISSALETGNILALDAEPPFDSRPRESWITKEAQLVLNYSLREPPLGYYLFLGCPKLWQLFIRFISCLRVNFSKSIWTVPLERNATFPRLRSTVSLLIQWGGGGSCWQQSRPLCLSNISDFTSCSSKPETCVLIQNSASWDTVSPVLAHDSGRWFHLMDAEVLHTPTGFYTWSWHSVLGPWKNYKNLRIFILHLQSNRQTTWVSHT